MGFVSTDARLQNYRLTQFPNDCKIRSEKDSLNTFSSFERSYQHRCAEKVEICR